MAPKKRKKEGVTGAGQPRTRGRLLTDKRTAAPKNTGALEGPASQSPSSVHPGLEESTAPASKETHAGTKIAFPIVGVGASAGGMEAFSELLKRLTPDTGMAFVLIQHLDPERESALVDLLSRVSKLPVHEVTHGTLVEPNHVYVIPPNTNMGIQSGVLRLTPRTETRGLHMPIDRFFRSLAEDQGTKAIGIILSGSASDGTLGLKAIKAEGGITFAQDATAKYDGMPRSAIAAGCVDFVLPPQEIAQELIRLGQHPYLVHADLTKADEVPPDDKHCLDQIFGTLRKATGVDFAHYKHSTLKRRIQRRMVLCRVEELREYARLLHDNAEEVQALYQDVLIHVTGFFRDAEVFEALKAVVFPELLKNRQLDDPIRLWVPGCATGEEAYSLAICLLEFLGGMPNAPPIKVFATDISEPALAKARAGVYGDSMALEVSPDRLRRFFVQSDSGYQISQGIRDGCIFARQDVTRDPPFSRIDFVSCRNVLIYLGTELQKKVMPVFHYALKPNGYLLLGSAESMSGFPELFVQIDKKHSIFRRKETLAHAAIEMAASAQHVPETLRAENSVLQLPHVFDVQKEADRLVLARYAPTGVVIDENMQVMYFRGHTGRYLQPAPGAVSFDLLKMAREGLLLELRAAIQSAKRLGRLVRKTGVHVKTNDHVQDISIEVLPMSANRSKQRYFVVLFAESAAPEGKSRRDTATNTRRQTQAQRARADRHVEELQRELGATNEYLQSVIQELEASNEELKSANEEILSSNEELQSTNEELETAKEELQATNEELGTVNEELQNRNNEISQVNNDVINLLASVNIPIVMLGCDLRVRRFTPSAQKVLNLIPTDIGRPIGDMKPKINVPDLEQLIHEVVDTFAIKEREVQDTDGHWYSMCIRPYRTLENRIDGAVLILIDVDTRKQAEMARSQLAVIADSTDDAIIGETLDGTIVIWNSGAERMYGYSADEIKGRSAAVLLPPDRAGELEQILETAKRGERLQHFETVRVRKDGRTLDVSLTITPTRDPDGNVTGLSVVGRDVTQLKEARQRAMQTERLAAIGQMMAALAHESRNALQRSQASLEMLALRLEGQPDIRTLLDSMQQAQNHLHRLYEEVRNYASPMPPERRTCHLGELLEEIWKQLTSARSHPAARLVQDDNNLDLHCVVDRAMIGQVFRNVLENSLDACADPCEITASWSETELAGRAALQLALRDNGPGFTMEARNKMFTPFFTTKQHGTGLGMAIAKRIIETHGGETFLGKQDDKPGATFVMKLPKGTA